MNMPHCYMDFWGGIVKKEDSWVKRVPVLHFDSFCPIPCKKAVLLLPNRGPQCPFTLTFTNTDSNKFEKLFKKFCEQLTKLLSHFLCDIV